MEDIDALKREPAGARKVKYRLNHATVFVSPGGFHFTDYLDPVEEIAAQVEGSALTEERRAHIENGLQSNPARFENHVSLVRKHAVLERAKILDIGCGGGRFLSLIRGEGAEVLGIELSDSNAQYALTEYDLRVYKHPVESAFWQQGYAGHFDVVTLWDVIEHVNYPLQTLAAASNLLKRGGLLMIDTPCRNSFYHRVGAVTYALSRGKYPTFLNAMYSNHPFGHKQIFSTSEIREAIQSVGFEVVELKKFHELSFPYEAYLKGLLRSDTAVRLALPLTRAVFAVHKISNKVVVVGRKA